MKLNYYRKQKVIQLLVILIEAQLIRNIDIIIDSTNDNREMCPSNYYLESKSFKCKECEINCLQCSSSVCEDCQTGRNINGSCLTPKQDCEGSSYFDPINKICVPCNIPFCLKCSNETECQQQKCENNFELKDGKCIYSKLLNEKIEDNLFQVTYKDNLDQINTSYSCPYMSQQEYKYCQPQNLCSIQQHNIHSQFIENIQEVIQYNQYIIALGSKQVIVYNEQSEKNEMKVEFELINLIGKENEKIRNGFMIGFNLLIFTNSNIYVYNINFQLLISKLIFSQDIIQSYKTYKYYWYDNINKIIYYLSLDNQYLNLKLTKFKVIDNTNENKINNFQLYYLNSKIIYQSQSKISQYAYFPQIQNGQILITNMKTIIQIDLITNDKQEDNLIEIRTNQIELKQIIFYDQDDILYLESNQSIYILRRQFKQLQLIKLIYNSNIQKYELNNYNQKYIPEKSSTQIKGFLFIFQNKIKVVLVQDKLVNIFDDADENILMPTKQIVSKQILINELQGQSLIYYSLNVVTKNNLNILILMQRNIVYFIYLNQDQPKQYESVELYNSQDNENIFFFLSNGFNYVFEIHGKQIVQISLHNFPQDLSKINFNQIQELQSQSQLYSSGGNISQFQILEDIEYGYNFIITEQINLQCYSISQIDFKNGNILISHRLFNFDFINNQLILQNFLDIKNKKLIITFANQIISHDYYTLRTTYLLNDQNLFFFLKLNTYLLIAQKQGSKNQYLGWDGFVYKYNNGTLIKNQKVKIEQIDPYPFVINNDYHFTFVINPYNEDLFAISQSSNFLIYLNETQIYKDTLSLNFIHFISNDKFMFLQQNLEEKYILITGEIKDDLKISLSQIIFLDEYWRYCNGEFGYFQQLNTIYFIFRDMLHFEYDINIILYNIQSQEIQDIPIIVSSPAENDYYAFDPSQVFYDNQNGEIIILYKRKYKHWPSIGLKKMVIQQNSVSQKFILKVPEEYQASAWCNFQQISQSIVICQNDFGSFDNILPNNFDIFFFQFFAQNRQKFKQVSYLYNQNRYFYQDQSNLYSIQNIFSIPQSGQKLIQGFKQQFVSSSLNIIIVVQQVFNQQDDVEVIVYSADSFEILQTIPQIFYNKENYQFKWNEQYQIFFIIKLEPFEFVKYGPSNKFQQPLNMKQLSKTKLECEYSQFHTLIICTGFGIYNYMSTLVFENKDIKLNYNKELYTQTFTENTRYIYICKEKDYEYLGFDTKTNSYFNPINVSDEIKQIKTSFILFIIPEVESQGLFIKQKSIQGDNACYIVELPSLKLLKKISSIQDNQFHCFSIKSAPVLMANTMALTTGYKLPFKDELEIIYQKSKFEINVNEQSQSFGIDYFSMSYKENNDIEKIIEITYIDLLKGEVKLFSFGSIAQLPIIVDYNKYFKILITSQQIISLDQQQIIINIAPRVDDIILINNYFNRLIFSNKKVDLLNKDTSTTFTSIDISEIFPANSNTLLAYNKYKIQSRNIFNEQLNSYIYMNYDHMTIEELDSKNKKSILLRSQDVFEDKKELKYLKTKHEIFQIANDIIGLFYQCRIIFFKKNGEILYSKYLLEEYNCSLYILSRFVYYYNYNTKKLHQLRVNNQQQIEEIEIYTATQSVKNIFKVQNKNEEYILLSYPYEEMKLTLIEAKESKIFSIQSDLNQKEKISFDIKCVKSIILNENLLFVMGNYDSVLIYQDEKNFLQDLKFQMKVYIQSQTSIESIDAIVDSSNIFIYAITKNRIHLVYKDLTLQKSVYEKKVSQSLHTISKCYLKILSNQILAIYSSKQITIYSNTLEIIGFIQENIFLQISDIFILQNQTTFVFQDSQRIYIFNINIRYYDQNKRLKLIKQFNDYINPQILRINEKQNKNKSPILTIIGTDTKQIFEINHNNDMQYQIQVNKEPQNCTLNIKEYSQTWQQKLQIVDILNQSQQQEINLALELTSNKELYIPTSIDIDNQNEKIINLDVNILNSEIILLQNLNINLQQNLKSLKIENGNIVFSQKYNFIDMKLFQIKNAKIIIKKNAFIHLSNIEMIVFDNVTLEFESNYANDFESIFQFKSSKLVLLNKIVFDYIELDKKLFFLNQCNNISIKDIVINQQSKNQSKIKSTLIHVLDNPQQFSLNGLRVTNSIVCVLLYIQNANNVVIQNINLINTDQYPQGQKRSLISQRQIQNRNLQDEEIKIINSLIYIEYVANSTQISIIDIQSCNSLMSLINYINEYSYYDDQDKNTKAILSSENSKISIENLNVEQSTFLGDFISLQNPEIYLSKITLIKNKDSFITVRQSTKILKLSDINLTENSTQNPLINIFNSKLYASNLNLTNNIGDGNEKTNCIQIFESNFIIVKLHGKNNNLGKYFLSIDKSNNNQINTQKEYDQYEFNSLVDLDVQGQNNGAVSVVSVDNITFLDSIIHNNKCPEKGAGLNIKNSTNCTLKNVIVTQNIAAFYGGGIYLENSNLALKGNTLIHKNTAKIGGGIRYNNTNIYPDFLKQDLDKIINNEAAVFGKNFGSNPTHIVVQTQLKNLTSSFKDKKTKIYFQLYGEDQQIVDLQKLYIISQEQPDIYKDMLQALQYTITSKNDAIIIDTKSSLKNPPYINNQLYFETCLANNGYDNLNSFKQNNQLLPSQELTIASDSHFYFPQNGVIQYKQLSENISIQFRDCKKGEIIKRFGQKNNYECFECEQNTFSLADPYSNDFQNQCHPCPKGVKSCKMDQIIPYEEYWRDGDTDFVSYCENNPLKCTQIDTINGCSEGGYGPYCESCDYNNFIWQNHSFGKKNRYECAICGDTFYRLNQYLFPLVVGIIFLIYIVFSIIENQQEKIMKLKAIYLNKTEIINISSSLNEVEKPQVIIKILISYFQIISIVQNFKIRLPDELQKLIFFFGNTLETTYYSLDCMFINLGLAESVKMVYLRLIWSVLTPIVYLILLMVVLLILRKIKFIKSDRNIYLPGIWQFYYMFYTGIIQQTFGTISCRNINNKSYVLLDVQYECYDSQYFFYNFVFSIPAILIVLIPPFILANILKKNKKNLLQIGVYLNYGFYYSEYKKEYYYWEIIKMIQKIIVYIIISAFNQSNVVSGMIISITIIFYLKLQVIKKPFQFEDFNELDYQSQISAILTIFFCLMNTNSTLSFVQILAVIFAISVNLFFIMRIIYLLIIHYIILKDHEGLRKFILAIQQITRSQFIKKAIKKRNFAKMNKNWALLKFIIRSKQLVSHYYSSQQKCLTQTQVKGIRRSVTNQQISKKISEWNNKEEYEQVKSPVLSQINQQKLIGIKKSSIPQILRQDKQQYISENNIILNQNNSIPVSAPFPLFLSESDQLETDSFYIDKKNDEGNNANPDFQREMNINKNIIKK